MMLNGEIGPTKFLIARPVCIVGNGGDANGDGGLADLLLSRVFIFFQCLLYAIDPAFPRSSSGLISRMP